MAHISYFDWRVGAWSWILLMATHEILARFLTHKVGWPFANLGLDSVVVGSWDELGVRVTHVCSLCGADAPVWRALVTITTWSVCSWTWILSLRLRNGTVVYK